MIAQDSAGKIFSFYINSKKCLQIVGKLDFTIRVYEKETTNLIKDVLRTPKQNII